MSNFRMPRIEDPKGRKKKRKNTDHSSPCVWVQELSPMFIPTLSPHCLNHPDCQEDLQRALKKGGVIHDPVQENYLRMRYPGLFPNSGLNHGPF